MGRSSAAIDVSDCARETGISSVGFGHVSESEHFRHSLDEIVLSHRGVDLNGGHFQTLRFLAEDVCEHPIALKQVAQGSFRIGGPGEKSRRRSKAVMESRDPHADAPG